MRDSSFKFSSESPVDSKDPAPKDLDEDAVIDDKKFVDAYDQVLPSAVQIGSRRSQASQSRRPGNTVSTFFRPLSSSSARLSPLFSSTGLPPFQQSLP